MNDENRNVDGEQAHARDAVRGLSAPAPDPAFRARLRREFTAGTLAARARRVVPLPAWRRPAFVPAALAAAAALVAVFALGRAPRWELTAWDGGGAVTVDGREVTAGDGAALLAALHPGARVTTSAGTQLALRGGRDLAIVATPNSAFALPALPGRWWSRALAAGVDTGEVRFTTGAGFHGAKLMVATGEAHVLVTGTTLAVIRDAHGTCVCLYEGHLRMGRVGGDMEPLDPGNRRVIYRDGRPNLQQPLEPGERMKLRMLRDAERAPLGRAGGAPADTGAAVPPL